MDVLSPFQLGRILYNRNCLFAYIHACMIMNFCSLNTWSLTGMLRKENNDSLQLILSSRML
jgi:hypothetical protein